MLSKLQREQRNAHVVASVQHRHAVGAYKPLHREFAEQLPPNLEDDACPDDPDDMSEGC